jgi:hypothetical protein
MGSSDSDNVMRSYLYLQILECRNSCEGFPTDHFQLVVADIPAMKRDSVISGYAYTHNYWDWMAGPQDITEHGTLHIYKTTRSDVIENNALQNRHPESITPQI